MCVCERDNAKNVLSVQLDEYGQCQKSTTAPVMSSTLVVMGSLSPSCSGTRAHFTHAVTGDCGNLTATRGYIWTS